VTIFTRADKESHCNKQKIKYYQKRKKKREREQEKNQLRSILKYRVGGKKKEINPRNVGKPYLIFLPILTWIPHTLFDTYVIFAVPSTVSTPSRRSFVRYVFLVWHPWRPAWQYTNTFVTVAHETSLISRR